MTTIDDPRALALLGGRNHAVLSTLGADGSLHSAVVWVDVEDGRPVVNGAEGRRWPADLDANPTTVLVAFDGANQYSYVEIRGTASRAPGDADQHIDTLAKKYLGVDAYPGRTPGERRVKYVLEPTRVRVWGR